MAFIVAGLVFVITMGLAFLTIMADMMSDSVSDQYTPVPVLIVGLSLTAIIASSHWWPHLGW
jgi:hypothetical protein